MISLSDRAVRCTNVICGLTGNQTHFNQYQKRNHSLIRNDKTLNFHNVVFTVLSYLTAHFNAWSVMDGAAIHGEPGSIC